MTTILEIAIYAAIMSGGAPLVCTGEDHALVTCTSGVQAALPAIGIVRFSNGVTIERDKNGYPRFSNGIHSWLGSTGWITFSNGLQLRRETVDAFKFSSGLVCRAVLPSLVECAEAHRASERSRS